MTPPPNPYEVFGLTPDATDEEIHKRYRKLAMQYHPDRNPGDDKAVEMFKKVSTAYETLSDPVKRSRVVIINRPPRPQKPAKKKKVEPDLANTGRLNIADAPPPKFDLWGKPIVPQDRQEWKDVFAGHYESQSAPDLR